MLLLVLSSQTQTLVNVILIHFHLFDGKIRRGSNFLEKCFYDTPICVQKLFPVLANKNQVVEDEKLGMVLCLIIHDERALTLFIFSNLEIGFKATFLPESSIKMA